jgi:pilus assembly protein Flp/PilA
MMRAVLRRLGPRERGATAVEYGLLLGLIAAVIIGTVAVYGTRVLGLFTAVPPF